MVLELVATAALGLGVGGVVLALRYFSGGRVPGYMVPIAAGLGMLLFSLWSEYSWFSRVRSQLPERVAILRTFEERSTLKPWSYLVPRIERFSAFDPASLHTHPDFPDLRMVEVVLVAHLQPTFTVTQLVDCAAGRSAEVDGQLTLSDGGAPVDADWQRMDEGDPLLVAACGG